MDENVGVALMIATAFKAKPESYALVTTNLYNAQRLYDLLASFIGEDHCLFYPVDELLRSESLAASKEMLAQRLFVMDQMLHGKEKILITHAAATMRYLPDPVYFQELELHFQVGKAYTLQDIQWKLSQSGYFKVNKIDQSLEFAVRGDIVDIASVNLPHPIRLEFFGDVLESIRYFDLATQSSFEEIKKVTVLPASDLLFKENEIKSLKTKIEMQLEQDKTALKETTFRNLSVKTFSDYESIKNYSFHPKTYKYLGFVQENHFSILDYFAQKTVVLVHHDQLKTTTKLLLEEAESYFFEQFVHGSQISHLQMYQTFDRMISRHRPLITTSPFLSEGSTVFQVRPLTLSPVNLQQAMAFIGQILNSEGALILALQQQQHIDTISKELKHAAIPFEMVDGTRLPKGKLGLALLPFEEGFELPNEKITYVTSRELFGTRTRVSRFMNRFKEAVILKSYQELNPGDYVVHELHGIGQFIGVKTMESDGVHRDYLHIAYAGTDVLYVPLSQFKLVRKFTGKEGTVPRLNKLNSSDWEKTKKKIKDRVNDLADRLIKLYRERAKVPGHAFLPDDELQRDFERQFPYELTDDQKQSLLEIKSDMEKATPMDRLLCGDVGFGKTEVAFRAAFKAISQHKQVALLAPTTLLARQHYEVALDRFANFGVNIAIISRLIPEPKIKEYQKDIASGKIHLVIGTHKILSTNVKFKDLGLLIVDEEQRFGVEQKERIKELKANVDVLTLSATPIPRTLQMSLIGIRSLSQIQTSPLNRVPIQTHVIHHDPAVVKELIERELSRDGQVFYVHNKVDDIFLVASKLSEKIKNARLGVVHGQMDKDEIEDVMIKFYANEINLLVCTTIVENGIDIPNANLIIVEDAAYFGLSQLYQIKGRVGRGARIAYAYLLYKEDRVLTEQASKRLKAIQEFTELGSGYKIAQRDLMIRGAGDILGPEQAGFIDTVGIDLYLQLLNEAMTEKQTGQITPPPEVGTTLNIDAYIPERYASDSDKIELYQEIERANDEKTLDTIAIYIRDLYGKMPEEVTRLLHKRRVDLYLQSEALEGIKETAEYIDVDVASPFVKLNRSGTLLFQKLQPYLKSLKVTFQNKMLRVRILKTDDWFYVLEMVLKSIVNVYQELLKL